MSEGSLKTTIITTCGTVTVALITAVGTYLVKKEDQSVVQTKPTLQVVSAAATCSDLLDPASEPWFIQTGYFEQKGGAATRVAHLKAKGLTGAKVVRIEKPGGEGYKKGDYVVLGPCLHSEALKMLDEAKKVVPGAVLVNGSERKISY